MRAEPSIYETIHTSLDHLEPQRRFGKSGRPIAATETYRRVVSTLLRDGIRTEKWVIINERDRTVTFASTYNGITGAHYDAAANTEWLSWDAIRSRAADYHFVPVDECPIAEPVSKLSASLRDRKIA